MKTCPRCGRGNPEKEQICCECSENLGPHRHHRRHRTSFRKGSVARSRLRPALGALVVAWIFATSFLASGFQSWFLLLAIPFAMILLVEHLSQFTIKVNELGMQWFSVLGPQSLKWSEVTELKVRMAREEDKQLALKDWTLTVLTPKRSVELKLGYFERPSQVLGDIKEMVPDTAEVEIPPFVRSDMKFEEGRGKGGFYPTEFIFVVAYATLRILVRCWPRR
jgi:hypothetical protein